MNAPSIDLLLPFYGDPALMRITVKSVQDQIDADWRLIVVDDGYPDPGISEWFAELGDERIDYHRNEQNLGANANYRRALSLSTADYIVFLGADDVVLPHFVGRTRTVLEQFRAEAAMYHPGVQVIDESGEPARSLSDRIKARLRPRASAPRLLAGEGLASSLLHGNWTYFPSICWRREVVDEVGFREGLHVVQDLSMILDLVVRGHAMALDPEVTFAYRRHSGSDSSVKALSGDRFREERAFFKTMAAEMQEHDWPRARRSARLYETSRLNALSLVPTAIRHRPAAAFTLVRHAFWR
jgi:glycosyltransferase involved in cell wall biosynthesis